MKPELQKIFNRLNKTTLSSEKINLSVISDAKQVVREAGDEIDFVDKLQNEIMDDLRKIEQISSKIKSNIGGLDNAKGYQTEIKNSMKQIEKAANELGADFKNIQEWRLLDASIEVIADLEADNKRIKQEAKKYIK